MKCPRCKSEMECESVPYVIQVAGYNPIHKIAYNGKTAPSTHYRCDNCDSEWTWTAGNQSLRMIDGGDIELPIK